MKEPETLIPALFRFQYETNTLYRAYVDALKVDPARVQSVYDVPFLPIQFFKTHSVVCGEFRPATVFESSGTTQTLNSRHPVKDTGIYTRSFMEAFRLFYGPVEDYVIL